VSKSDLRIDWATHEAAKYACENWHYSECVPKSKLVKIGAWESGVFVGVVIFGVGATSDLVKRYGLTSDQGCELVRVALKKHASQVTRIVALAVKFLKRTNPGLRLIVSFADPEQGHHGGIYQGGNWAYIGRTAASDEYIYKGKRWQGRSFRNSYKGMEKHPDVKVVKGSSKHRYLMPLDDEMRKRIEPLRKPYPKRVRSVDSDTTAIQAVESGANPTRTL
jgi:hypothetical protein